MGVNSVASAVVKPLKPVGNVAKSVARPMGNAAKSGAKHVGNAAKSSAKHVGKAAKSGAKTVGHAAKSVAKPMGTAAMTVAKPMGHAAKTVAKPMKPIVKPLKPVVRPVVKTVKPVVNTIVKPFQTEEPATPAAPPPIFDHRPELRAGTRRPSDPMLLKVQSMQLGVPVASRSTGSGSILSITDEPSASASKRSNSLTTEIPTQISATAVTSVLSTAGVPKPKRVRPPSQVTAVHKPSVSAGMPTSPSDPNTALNSDNDGQEATQMRKNVPQIAPEPPREAAPPRLNIPSAVKQHEDIGEPASVDVSTRAKPMAMDHASRSAASDTHSSVSPVSTSTQLSSKETPNNLSTTTTTTTTSTTTASTATSSSSSELQNVAKNPSLVLASTRATTSVPSLTGTTTTTVKSSSSTSISQKPQQTSAPPSSSQSTPTTKVSNLALPIPKRSNHASDDEWIEEEIIEEEEVLEEEIIEEEIIEEAVVDEPIRTTTIKFDEFDEMYEVLHLNDYSKIEVSKTWYERKDFNEMVEEARKTADKMEEISKGTGDKKELKAKYEPRGLESWTTLGATKVRMVKEAAMDAVWNEQQRQWTTGRYNAEQIRVVYQKVSRGSQLAAEQRAFSDELIVKKILEEEELEQQLKRRQKLLQKSKALIGKSVKTTGKLTGKVVMKTGKGVLKTTKIAGKSGLAVATLDPKALRDAWRFQKKAESNSQGLHYRIPSASSRDLIEGLDDDASRLDNQEEKKDEALSVQSSMEDETVGRNNDDDGSLDDETESKSVDSFAPSEGDDKKSRKERRKERKERREAKIREQKEARKREKDEKKKEKLEAKKEKHSHRPEWENANAVKSGKF